MAIATGRSDIDAAIEKMSSTFAIKKQLKALPESIRPDETVSLILHGTYRDKPAIAVLTDQRVFFAGRWAFRVDTEDFPLSRISSVELRKKMLLSDVAIYVSNQEATLTGTPQQEAQEFVNQVRRLISTSATSTPSAPKESISDQLLKLKTLLDAGVLNEAEYEAKRQHLITQL